MTVRVQRTFEFDVPPERIWEFIDDPARRADAISVVEDYDVNEDGTEATWQVRLPIPFISSTVEVRTTEIEREPPTRVKFVGRSRALRVTGEHLIEETENGCRLVNEFIVEGTAPGVETFFKRNFETELDNLEQAVRDYLAATETETET